MISLTETGGGFSALARMYKRLVSDLFQSLPLSAQLVSLEPSHDAFKQGMCHNTCYLIKGGMLGVKCQNRRLFTWDEGDLILPDAGSGEVSYDNDGPVLLAAYPTVDLVEQVLANPALAKLWTRILTTQQAMMLRLLASQVGEDSTTTPGFAYYSPGDTIIRQGDSADYVFSLFEGSAEVLVDDVVVGQVSEGEIIGAIAVLTHAPRGATVKARSRCSVVKVPKHQFKNLIRSNPAMIHGLLTDMARQITHLNNQVVQLSA